MQVEEFCIDKFTYPIYISSITFFKILFDMKFLSFENSKFSWMAFCLNTLAQMVSCCQLFFSMSWLLTTNPFKIMFRARPFVGKDGPPRPNLGPEYPPYPQLTGAMDKTVKPSIIAPIYKYNSKNELTNGSNSDTTVIKIFRGNLSHSLRINHLKKDITPKPIKHISGKTTQ